VLPVDSVDGSAHHNIANVLRLSRRFAEAEVHYRRAAHLLPRVAEIRHSLATTLEELGQYALAEQEYRAAIRLRPDLHEAQFDLALLLLAGTRYAEGWPYFESRFQIFPDLQALRTIPIAQWQGETLAGKSILLLPEQGYGDTIQCIRYVALLKEKGAASISVLCKPILAPLLRTVKFIDFLITDPSAIRSYDYWAPLMSLPYRFSTTVDTIPSMIPYVGVFQERLQAWHAKLPRDGLRVGLVWQGNRQHDNDAYRSISDFSVLAPLWRIRGVHFISLQVGDAEYATEAFEQTQPLRRLGRSLRDFGDTAAVIAQLNLVICVDTAVAHLCGALGIACWMMLPASGVDWRWHRGGNVSPWYPKGMYLFRQNERGWPGVVSDVCDALKDAMDPQRNTNAP